MLAAMISMATFAAPPPATFRFARGVLSDDMVLQSAPQQAMIWGFVPLNATVTVTLGAITLNTTIGPDQAHDLDSTVPAMNTFRVLLPATPASFDKYNISATYSFFEPVGTIYLRDIMFGDVWVCSGQSNMQYPIASSPHCWNASNVNCTDRNKSHNTKQCGYGCANNSDVEVAHMKDYDDGMRLYTTQGGSSKTPVAEQSAPSQWMTPSEHGGSFSATCWFFGRSVYTHLKPKRPLGLIQTNVGGTPDQHWSSPDALSKCKGKQPWDPTGKMWPDNFTDSVLWNAMVVPLLRTTHIGAIWYQGEANSRVDGRQYNCSFPAMIEDWRAKWNKYTDGATPVDFPFGWAQLNSDGGAASYPATTPFSSTPAGSMDEWQSGFSSIRLAESTTLSLENTFQAVILDTPVASGSVHSPYKQPCGARLARGGLAVKYGMKELHAVDPIATSAKLTGTTAVVTVAKLGTKGVLANVGAVGFEVLGACPSFHLDGAEVGANQCWLRAPVTATTATTVSVQAVAGATAIRYLYYSSPCTLQPYKCAVYTNVTPLGPLSGEDQDFLPLGPFIMAFE